MGSTFAIAVGLGAAIAVQVAVLGRASADSHSLVVSLALQISGTLIGLIWMLHHQSWPVLVRVGLQWWWLPLGVLGWGVVGALGHVSARLGTGITLVVVVTAQLVAGLVIDLATGRVSPSVYQPVAVVLLVAGVLLLTRAEATDLRCHGRHQEDSGAPSERSDPCPTASRCPAQPRIPLAGQAPGGIHAAARCGFGLSSSGVGAPPHTTSSFPVHTTFGSRRPVIGESSCLMESPVGTWTV